MTSNERFFQQRQAAAVLKHGILRRYPTVFATMTGTHVADGRVVYIDGYAGPGRYDDGSPGSPLLAVETAARVATWRRSVECIFIEREERHFANLRRCLTESAPEGLTWHAWHGDVEDHVDAVLARARGLPLLAFLDPFGSALPFDVLRRSFLARPATVPTEVLLNVNLEMVWRIGGLLRTGERPSGTKATLDRLDRFLGGGWWRETFANARGDELGSAAEAAQQVAAEYCARVRRDTGFRAFQVPVRRRPDHAPLFLLVLFYRHLIAPWKFNDEVSRANADWRRACREEDLAEEMARRPSGQGSLFDDAAPDEDPLAVMAREQEARLEATWVDQIAANLQATLARTGRVRLLDQMSEVYGTTLGQAREMHVRAAWDRLSNAGMVLPRDKSLKRIEQGVVQRT